MHQIKWSAHTNIKQKLKLQRNIIYVAVTVQKLMTQMINIILYKKVSHEYY